jgi:hypothetical protein
LGIASGALHDKFEGLGIYISLTEAALRLEILEA